MLYTWEEVGKKVNAMDILSTEKDLWFKKYYVCKSVNDVLKFKESLKNTHEFSKEDIWMANKYMKRSSTSLIIREMQIKTTIRYYLILVRMAIIKKSTKQ